MLRTVLVEFPSPYTNSTDFCWCAHTNQRIFNSQKETTTGKYG